MDEPTRRFFELSFELTFLKKKGEEFQKFFADLMSKCHPSDFIPTVAWGRVGDRKNDGYLKSTRTIFQVYAPMEIRAADTIDKMREDFTGAMEHWSEHCGAWVFVHNSRNGLPPDVMKTLLELGQAHPGVPVNQWGYEEVKRKAFELGKDDLSSLLGPPVSTGEMAALGFDDLQDVLRTIAQQELASQPDFRPVPQEKLSQNGLSDAVKEMLKAGMVKETLVQRFFAQHSNPTFGDRIAEAFKGRYLELKGTGMSPDQIFMNLQEFAGGARRGVPRHEAAVLAVLAYLFVRCDIFDRTGREVQA